MTPVKRAPSPAAPTNEPSAATNTVAAQECTYYNLDSLNAISKQFPTIWQTASIVSGDTAATSVWNTIQSSGIIPANVQQKGTGGKGNFTGVTSSYSNSDPDCWWSYSNCVTPKHTGIPDDIWQCPEPDTWGLTFDDGPNCSHNAFYDFLSENNQKATLFYIGSNVMDWPLEAQRGIVDGHHVCVHTWSHPYMTQLTDEEVFAELYYTGKAIKDVTGVTPRCWRPPYGDVDDRVRAIATGLGMSTNLWDADTFDWQMEPAGNLPKASVDANYASIISGVSNKHGNLVLTHEINGGTMSEMIEMYPSIKKAFKNIVPISACMNITNPYPEDISYPDFAAYVSGDVNPSGLPAGTAIKVTSATYDPIAAASATASSTSSAAGKASSGGASSSSTSSGSSSAAKATTASDTSVSKSAGSALSSSTSLSLLAGISALLAFVILL
jgi:peptidoglycan/xylan/chitin deacetylase (PgdA/CDA1 family)